MLLRNHPQNKGFLVNVLFRNKTKSGDDDDV